MFGGRIAEELIFGPENVTTGASNDIQQATNLARRMVTEWGMSEKLGPLKYSDNEEEVFLGHSVTQRKNVSDATAKLIDDEIRRIIDTGESEARRILSEHIADLHKIADALLEYETLSGEEVRALLRGEPIKVGGGDAAPPRARSSVPTSGSSARDDAGKGRPPTGLEPEPQPGA
jgi:cell division protease FtsH